MDTKDLGRLIHLLVSTVMFPMSNACETLCNKSLRLQRFNHFRKVTNYLSSCSQHCSLNSFPRFPLMCEVFPCVHGNGLGSISAQNPGSECSGQSIKSHSAFSLRISFGPLINIFSPKSHVVHIPYCMKFKLWYLPTMKEWKSLEGISFKPQGSLGKNIAK